MDEVLTEVLQQSHDDARFHGSLPADHPMLQQAQDKLKEQILATKKRLEEELQERKYAIKVRRHAQTAACPQSTAIVLSLVIYKSLSVIKSMSL